MNKTDISGKILSIHQFTIKIKGIELKFKTHPRLFSPTMIDIGTLAMLSLIDFEKDDKVLDLGCGYGVVGILAARIIGPTNVVMADIDPIAVAFAQENAELNSVSGIKIVQSDGFKNFKDNDFTKIISNPPYHVDFTVPKRFIHDGFNRLRIGGRFYMVTKRRLWYKNKFISIFGGVQIHNIEGYHIFVAEKRNVTYAKIRKSFILRRKRVQT